VNPELRPNAEEIILFPIVQKRIQLQTELYEMCREEMENIRVWGEKKVLKVTQPPVINAPHLHGDEHCYSARREKRLKPLPRCYSDQKQGEDI